MDNISCAGVFEAGVRVGIRVMRLARFGGEAFRGVL